MTRTLLLLINNHQGDEIQSFVGPIKQFLVVTTQSNNSSRGDCGPVGPSFIFVFARMAATAAPMEAVEEPINSSIDLVADVKQTFDRIFQAAPSDSQVLDG